MADAQKSGPAGDNGDPVAEIEQVRTLVIWDWVQKNVRLGRARGDSVGAGVSDSAKLIHDRNLAWIESLDAVAH